MAIIEIVRFKLAVGVDEQTFLRENEQVEREYIPKQPGFISREAARGDDGEWLVVVHWQTEQDADASMNKFMSDPDSQGFVAALDNSTLSMKRYNIV